MGHFVATALAGLIMFTTGSYLAVLGLSMAYSLGGVVVIALLDSNSQVLIPDWESELPDEAPAQTGGAPTRSTAGCGPCARPRRRRRQRLTAETPETTAKGPPSLAALWLQRGAMVHWETHP